MPNALGFRLGRAREFLGFLCRAAGDRVVQSQGAADLESGAAHLAVLIFR